MIRTSSNFRFPRRYGAHLVCGLAAMLFVFASISSAAAAGVGAMPGVLEGFGEPLKAITSAPSPDLVEVGRKGKKAKKRAQKRKKAARKAKNRRKARKRRASKRRSYKRHYYKRRYSRGPSIYLSIPLGVYPQAYGYRPYYAPSYGRCETWRGRCAANWGYRTRSYFGCMRYHGCG